MYISSRREWSQVATRTTLDRDSAPVVTHDGGAMLIDCGPGVDAELARGDHLDDLTEIEPGATVTVDRMPLATIAAFHPVPTLAMRFDDLGLAYTADAGLAQELLDLCRDVPVLLAEATYRHSAGIDVSAHGHLAGRTVGQLAAAAGAGRLVITHLADPTDAEEILAEARDEYDGPVDLAAPGLVVPLG